MINERSSAQSNASSSTNMQYGYPTGPFDLMNIQPMQNPSDIYSYYPPSLYQPFSGFDEHNQWGSAETSTGLPPNGPVQFHAPMYTPTGLDIPHNPFDYPQPPPHAYPHYHPGFTPSTFPTAPSTGTSNFDMSWNPHNLSIQQQMPPVGGGGSNNNNNTNSTKKSTVYDEYPSNTGGVGDMLAQHMKSVNLGNNDSHNYNNGTSDPTQNINFLSSKEQQQQQQQQQQQHYQSNGNHFSLSRPTQPSGPKSYASVVSSDTINSNSNKNTISSSSNFPLRTSNEHVSNPSNDSLTTRSNTQQSRNNSTGFNSRSQQQQQSFGNSGFLQWTNNNSERSSNNNNNNTNTNRRQNPSSSRTMNSSQDTNRHDHQYNPQDFNLNPKGARFFVIKSYSEDDVHRSIKYNIWCSTEHGNKRLDNAFREREGKGPIYLFYSVNASGHFCGMAEMMSPLDYEHQTDVWHMSNKWQGKFEVKWIYVKDVPNQQFRNIRLENNENKPVTNSRDTQEVPYEKGKLMLKTLHMYRHKTSIFDDFQYYESKQAEETTTKTPSNDELDNNHQVQHSNRRAILSNRATQREQQEIDQDNEE